MTKKGSYNTRKMLDAHKKEVKRRSSEKKLNGRSLRAKDTPTPYLNIIELRPIVRIENGEEVIVNAEVFLKCPYGRGVRGRDCYRCPDNMKPYQSNQYPPWTVACRLWMEEVGWGDPSKILPPGSDAKLKEIKSNHPNLPQL